MITHNGKQVTLAMRNRQAINLIARNGKAMWDYAVHVLGIDAAAKAVILAEYGYVVWSDVRDYAKAHPAIVPFINQDPHLACSISENSEKERWLVNSNKSYFKTGVVKVLSDQIVEETYVKFDKGGGRRLTGISGTRAGYWGVTAGNAYELHGAQNETDTTYADGTDIAKRTFVRKDYISGADTGELQLNALQSSYNGNGIYRARTKVLRDGVLERDYVPYRDPSTGEMELLDLVTATFATRVGTFTEVIEDKAT